MKENKIILFDIDHTLFDTNKYRYEVLYSVAKYFPQIDYKEFIEKGKEIIENLLDKHEFTRKNFADDLVRAFSANINKDILLPVWLDESLLSRCIYPDVIHTLQELSKQRLVKLGIFSTGDILHQTAKISSIQHFFEENTIHIFSLKEDHVDKLINKFINSKIIFVDDLVNVLEKAKKASNRVRTIYIQREREKIKSKANYSPDYTINSLTELIPLVDKE